MSNSVVGDTLPVPLRASPWCFVGEGVKRVIFFCAALSLSHLRCQLSPGESLGLSGLFVRCVTVGFAVFFGGSKPPPYRLGEKSFIRWVTVLFADTVYFTKVDMFDLTCKSNSICCLTATRYAKALPLLDIFVVQRHSKLDMHTCRCGI